MISSVYSKGSSLDNLLRENDRSANRLVSWIILLHALNVAIVLFAYHFNRIELGYHYVVVLSYIALITEVLTGIFGLLYKANQSWLKWFLIPSFVLSSGLMFFSFGNASIAFLFFPIVLSSRYYNTLYTFSIAIFNYLCFIAVCLLNHFLDTHFSNVHLQHQLAEAEAWGDLNVLFNYTITIRSGEYLILTLLIIDIVKNGYQIGKKQVELRKSMDKIQGEFSIGAEIQQNILPATKVNSCDGKWTIGATMQAAKEVAGDFYDYFQVGKNHFVFLVADVSDKGLPAAMFMMSAKHEFRTAIATGNNLEESAILINQRLLKNNPLGMFVSAWIGCIDIHTGEGTYINAGHTFPILRHKDGTTEWITNKPDTFFGVFEHYTPKMHTFKLSLGDTLLLYTDGVPDCVNDDKERFGSDRLFSFVNTHDNEPQQLCKDIVSQCTTFANGAPQFDDITLLALKKMSEECASNNLDYDATVESVEQIIKTINEQLNAYECPENTRRLIDTAIDEICINIVDYAYGQDTGKIEVYYEIFENRIYIRIADSGKPFNPLKVNSPDLATISEYGGLGIHITKQVMDNLKYTYFNGRNYLEMVKYWK